ncbi:MAG: M23 family metallopeptidase [Bacteroidota bacterium]|nr:M23 family metallopeptidase [Bacteroidota bacterium]
MAKEKYKFDPESLSYEAKNDSKTKVILRFTLIVLFSAGAIVAALILFLPYFSETPEERLINQEQKLLRKEYEKLLEKKEVADSYLRELEAKDEQIYQQIFEAKQEDEFSQKKDVYDFIQKSSPMAASKKNQRSLDSLNAEFITASKSTSFLLQLVKSQTGELDFIPAIQPIYNPEAEIPVSGFGNLIDPYYKSPAFHEGIDFAVPRGTPVHATAEGKVIFAGRKRAGGLVVEIDHGNDYVTIYEHLSKIETGSYKVVKRGDVIGYVGNTGKSYSDHLHYEIQYKSKPIDPVNYFFLDLNFDNYAKMNKQVKKAGISLD